MQLDFALIILTLLIETSGQKLSTYNVDTSKISVSGISSGGAMAEQFHVAHSKIVMGIGAVAGPPYFCANANLAIALSSCTKYPDLIVVSELEATTYTASLAGSIDDPSNLKSSKVWMFSGLNDTVVYQGVIDKAIEYYENYVPKENIVYINNVHAEHAWITNNYGNKCNYLGYPYINNCNLDIAGNMLQHIYGKLNPSVNQSSANLLQFEQGYYTPGQSPAEISMAEYGYVYVPTSCQKGNSCGLHISFHGCLMDYASISTQFVVDSGLNSWAESNDIIVLYPQAQASQVIPYNPKACWDWWGYTGPMYAFQSGDQIVATANMISQLVGKSIFH